MTSLYLYGFVAGDAPAPPAALAGVGGAAVELIALGEVSAAVSVVPAEAFSEARVRERVRDLEWLAEQGALHERVVTWFVDQCAILPARLLTLYTGEQALREAISGREPALRAELETFADLREWDLKVSYDAEALGARLGEVSEEVRELEREIEAAPPGRRYLLERKLARRIADETSLVAERLARGLAEQMERAAVRSLPLAPPREAGELPVVLNVAYLVRRSVERALLGLFRAEAEQLGALGLRVQLSGPWAPYRFLGPQPGAPGGSPGER